MRIYANNVLRMCVINLREVSFNALTDLSRHLPPLQTHSPLTHLPRAEHWLGHMYLRMDGGEILDGGLDVSVTPMAVVRHWYSISRTAFRAHVRSSISCRDSGVEVKTWTPPWLYCIFICVYYCLVLSNRDVYESVIFVYPRQ